MEKFNFMYKLIATLLFLGLVVYSDAQTPTKLVFRKNWEVSYRVNANLDAKGMNTQNGMRTGGTTSSLKATMTIRCTDVQAGSATFTMTASDAHVSDGTSSSDVVTSLIELGKIGKIHNPFHKKKDKMDKHLGHPVTFVQKESGEIINVSFNHKDKSYYNNIKLGFINALNTRVVPPGSTQVIQEKDVVGSHKSTVTGQAATMMAMAMNGGEMISLPTVSLKKTFDQTGFSEFPDPALKPQNVKLQAETSTQIHNTGYVHTSTVNQVVAMVNIGSKPAAMEAFENLDMMAMLHESVKRQSAQDNPGDLFLSSFGSLNIVANSEPKFFLEASSERLTVNYVEEETFTGDLFQASVMVHQQMMEEVVPAIDLEESLEKIFSLKEKALNNENAVETIHTMESITRYMEVETDKLSLLVPHLESIQHTEDEQSEAVAGLCFYILSGINKKESSDLFTNYGFKSSISRVQKAAILASHTARIQHADFIQSLVDLHNELPQEHPHKAFTLLALGSVASYSSYPEVAKEILVNEARDAYDHEERTIDALLAIGNAGPSVFSEESELLDLNFHVHPSLKVQDKLVQVLQDSFGMDYEKDADYPFSKSKQVGFELGGKTVGAKFDAEVFLGTNFNCNQPTFNYKASGKTGVYALLFGKRKEAVGADAEYGQNGGAPLSNSAHVRVWGKTIKSMNFPGLGECKEKTYPIAHASPGFSVKYTVWVSVVPITFSASASLKLNLNWGWQLCPRDLYAEVSITPEADLVFGGDAKIDLLIIKAGTGIQGSLGASIVPKAYVKGTQCLIGMEVNMIRRPLEIKMYSYAQWKKCKLLIFKCKWGTRKEHTWFKWSKEAKTQKLWNKDFKIIKGGK